MDGYHDYRSLRAEEDSAPVNGYFFANALFAAFAWAIAYPPIEFVSAGLTVENLFYSFLGDPLLNLIDYECRKIILNRAAFGFLPIGYCLIFAMFNGFDSVFSLVPTSVLQYFTYVSFAVFIGSLLYIAYHHYTKYENIEAISQLRCYSEDISQLKNHINTEYRSYDNFTTSLSHSSKVVVSNSWLINITRFHFTIVNLSDVRLEAVDAQEFPVDFRTMSAVQFLRIKATITDKPIPSFFFRIKSTAFNDLQSKLNTRINVARDILLFESPSDRFVAAFTDIITENESFVYQSIQDLDDCLGCSQLRSNVKLVRRCPPEHVEGVPDCRMCYCRPMWCVTCIARVFHAQQDPNTPTVWMDGKGSCPTCRAPFCVQDVSMVVASNE